MRPLKDVALTSVKTVQSFAAKALSKEEITVEEHDKIRTAANSLLEVVNTAVGEKVTPVKREQKTIQQRRKRRNSDVMNQIAARQDHREAVVQ